MKKAERLLFFETLDQRCPDPQTELSFVNTYTLLVAVVLSAQATDKGVNKATEKFFSFIQTPQEMIAWGEENLLEAIKSIGLFRTKAKNVMALSHRLVEHFKGQVPDTREDLMTLPGVGRKTANVVLNVACQRPTFPVDTHIFRVSNRTGLAPGDTPLKVELMLEKRVPKVYALKAHHLLILHGRYTCTARKPKCQLCSVSHVCDFARKTKVSDR